MSCLLYGTEIWGFNHTETMERLQLQFLKQTFGVAKWSPSYAVRLEAGRCKTEVTVWRMMLKFWIKVLKMPPHRTPRKLYDRLKTVSARMEISTNLSSQIKWILRQVGYEHLWDAEDPKAVVESLDDITNKLAHISWEEDWNFAATSEISYYFRFLREEPLPAFVTDHPFKQRKTISQLRLASKLYPFYLIGDHTFGRFNSARDCECCNLKSAETIEHFLFVYPRYQSARRHLVVPHILSLHTNGEDSHLIDIFRDPSEQLTRDIFLYTSSALKVRNFIMDQ